MHFAKMNDAGVLADGTKAMDRLNRTLDPTLGKVEGKLRAEMNIRRPWFRRWLGG
jgi:hypothetical protein